MKRLLRSAIKAAEDEGLEVTDITRNRHVRISVRNPANGHTGFLTLHLGSNDRSYREASLRSQARSIARGNGR